MLEILLVLGALAEAYETESLCPPSITTLQSRSDGSKQSEYRNHLGGASVYDGDFGQGRLIIPEIRESDTEITYVWGLNPSAPRGIFVRCTYIGTSIVEEKEVGNPFLCELSRSYYSQDRSFSFVCKYNQH